MATTHLDFVRSASAEAAETSAPEAAAKGVRLQLALEHAETAWVTGDAALLRRAVENLLSNALKVTPAGGTVELLLQRFGSALSIAVCDEGPGIAACCSSTTGLPVAPSSASSFPPHGRLRPA